MSVPLDNLYHWVNGLLPGPAIIYLFYPHGSKNISDFDQFQEYDSNNGWFPAVIVHDQEPLDWNFYNCPDHYRDLKRWDKWGLSLEMRNLRNQYLAHDNLKSIVRGQASILYDDAILIHSEKNSSDLLQYQQNGYVCVHYWAHAVIARDWYRFAQYDTRLITCLQPKKTFLIYCRDWSHRREYRLKFLELLIENNLDHVSQTSVMHTNTDSVHYSNYEFINPKFKLNNSQLLDKIPDNTFPSTSSAGYSYNDFVSSQISVVLETVFDDSRIHLTEKILKPIACGHPFILAAGPGALEYVRSYGFQTFSPWIDESYDQEPDSLKRIEKIIKAMKQIQDLQGQDLEDFSCAIKNIALFNKNHFFSKEFFDQVESELRNNLHVAMQQVVKSLGKFYLKWLRIIRKHKLLHMSTSRRPALLNLRRLRQFYSSGQSNPPEDLPV
jgi:hypothetical protein